MDRTILHVDMNNFYASVESSLRPELKGKPLAVAGDVEARHGVVLAKNYEAKKYGIQTGSPVWMALKLCPNLILVPPNHSIYRQVSKSARTIYEEYTDQVEPFGIDEAWLDVSGSLRLMGSGEKIANEIRMSIKTELGVTVSVGVSWNKIYAKLGSDMKKPDAITVITRENYKTNVWSLPVGDMVYAGRATQNTLSKYGIITIGDLAKTDVSFIGTILGKGGENLWINANGMDMSPVAKANIAMMVKSIGNSTTTPRDIRDNDDARMTFMALAESVGARAREQKLKGRTLAIHVRESSNGLKVYEKQCRLMRATNLTREIADEAYKLFCASYLWRVPVRSLGIKLTDLCQDDDAEQLEFLSDDTHREKLERIDSTMDALKARFGERCIQHASLYKEPWAREISDVYDDPLNQQKSSK